jgi:pyridoxal phosphate enzyme (YggS family)
MVRENLALIQKRIEAVLKAVRSPQEIILVAVTKGVGLPLIFEAIESGVVHIAESRVQETLLKYDSLNDFACKRDLHLIWHLVGHLQTNKAKDAVRIFDLIHSVDSVRLACEINRQAQKISKIQDILLEVNVAKEKSKFGLFIEEVLPVFAEIDGCDHIRVQGLMTVAPMVDHPQQAQQYFHSLKELRDRICAATSRPWPILSMGMTDDFEVAIQEGATMVRIGRGIFGERQ